MRTAPLIIHAQFDRRQRGCALRRLRQHRRDLLALRRRQLIDMREPLPKPLVIHLSRPPRRIGDNSTIAPTIRELSLHLLHALLVGDHRGGHFYLRSAVENIWRHVYFKDHPVEYRWVNSDFQVYQSIDDLRSYCKKTDEIDVRLQKSLDRIAAGYRKLSRFVHSTGTTSLQLDEMLVEIQLAKGELKKIVSYLRTFGRDMVLLCLVLHAKEMNNVHPLERNYAISYLDKPRKSLRLDVLS